LIEHLNLTKDEKSTLSDDKPFHTSITRSEKKWRPYCACTTTLENLVWVHLVTDATTRLSASLIIASTMLSLIDVFTSTDPG